MNITSNYIDDLNGKIIIEVEQKDYSEQVNSVLKKYSKSANIPGFRKGNVPIGLIRKQYGKAVIMDEINKLIDKELKIMDMTAFTLCKENNLPIAVLSLSDNSLIDFIENKKIGSIVR